MNQIKSIPFTILFLLLVFNIHILSAQNKEASIKGIIKTADGLPAGFVNVGVKGIKASITAEDGSYIIRNILPGSYTVKVSYVGLGGTEKTVRLVEGQTLELDFVLAESSQRLSEVIVTATRSNRQVLSIGKAGINPMDLPQSSSVVNSLVISEQQASKLSDVMKNVNGVALGSSRGSTTENFVARGYSLGSNNYFKNGSRYNSGSIPEVSTLKQVEVLKAA